MMKPEPDELELAHRARSGDGDALAELIERLRLGLFALAYAELRHYEDAQDAVAEALYQICRHADDLRDPHALRAWMHTIVRNETHRLRRGKQAPHTSLDEADSRGAEDPSPLLRLDVERALRKLPRDQAGAVGLFYLSEWPIAAIARHLARPEGTIKRWLHHGRRRLATEMKGYFPMEKTWKACIVAPEITPAQLQHFTDALKASGYADVENVAEVRSINDLYHVDMSRFYAAEYEERNKQIKDSRSAHLVEPLASCDFLLLGEQIGGRTAFEFMYILRAIARDMPACLLIERALDSTVLAGWLAGFDLIFTLDAPSDGLQNFFTILRKGTEESETPV